LVRLVLREFVCLGALTHVDADGIERRFIEQPGVRERIENNHLRAADQLEPAHGNPADIARPRANQKNLANMCAHGKLRGVD
jgi:hypothetical protein